MFTSEEARAFLAERTALADDEEAAELGYLPLALAQAAAMITGQQLSYGTYLERLRALPTGEYLAPEPGQRYPPGVAAAVLLSLDGAWTSDQSGVSAQLMEIIAVLSGAGSAGRCCIRPGRRAFWPTRGNVWLRPWWIGRSGTWPAGHLIELGDSASQAVAVGEPLTADAERLLGPDHSDTLLAWDRLAAAYRAVGRNAEAILLLELVLAGRERRLAAEHPQTLAARNNLAAANNAAGRAG